MKYGMEHHELNRKEEMTEILKSGFRPGSIEKKMFQIT